MAPHLPEAIRHGAILRLRPIMMTALVAALGLLPAALATGVGTDSQRPFALVIVSGLFTRLLISVFLMPVLYSLVARPATGSRCDAPARLPLKHRYGYATGSGGFSKGGEERMSTLRFILPHASLTIRSGNRGCVTCGAAQHAIQAHAQ